jgi:hypothetical protein
MIGRRQIDHLDLVQLGKMLLLLFETQELLVDLPSMTQTTEGIVPTEELSKDLKSPDVECRMGGPGARRARPIHGTPMRDMK